MESKTILTFYFLFGKCFLATSSDLPTKALEPLLKNHCTILLLDIPSPFIQVYFKISTNCIRPLKDRQFL